MPVALAVHYTGDAGPGALARGLARRWRMRGLRVVVVNSLRYFLAEKPPERQAADLARLVGAHGRDADGPALPVLLSGFSFGADAVPFSYPLLRDEVRARVRLVSLISPTPRIAFHSTARSVLGLLDGTIAVAPAIAALPPALVLCTVGEDDPANPCRALRGIRTLAVPGGHRPHVDPALIADAVLDAFLSRAGPAPRPTPGG